VEAFFYAHKTSGVDCRSDIDGESEEADEKCDEELLGNTPVLGIL
jgi:hypothetical protein